jgi:SAM-dependent methyltransferase
MNIINNNKINMTLLNECMKRPEIYAKSTDKFWDDDYISEQMLSLHLNPEVESASKTKETIEAESTFIIVSAGINADKAVLDMGCGPGLYVKEFARTGAMVTGIDLSKRSIDYANENIKPVHPNTRFMKMNYLDMNFEDSFDVGTMIFYDFCVLSSDDQKKLLAKIHKALRKDGLFLFDILTENMGLPAATGISVCDGGFWSAESYIEIQQNFMYDEPKTLGQQYVVIEEDGSVRVTRFFSRLFSEIAIRELLNETGFKVKHLYKNLRGEVFGNDSETCGIIAVKA